MANLLYKLRSTARQVALDVLGAREHLFMQSALSLARPRIQLIYMHDVALTEEAAFRALLVDLLKHHRFVSHSEAVARLKSGQIEEPLLSISFDDGLKSNFRISQILDEFGISGCFFLCTSMVGETRADVLARFCRERLLAGPGEFLSWAEVEDMKARGHEIGSHTESHANLAETVGEELTREVSASRSLLISRLGECQHFSWPFGRFMHFSPEARTAVLEAGYDSCASAERGCHIAPASQPGPGGICLRRDHLMPDWPLAHARYFLASNARTAEALNSGWPDVLNKGAA